MPNNTLDAGRVRTGKRVTLDYHGQRGYGLAYKYEGDLWNAPGSMPFASRVDQRQGGGFTVIEDGGERYDSAYENA